MGTNKTLEQYKTFEQLFEYADAQSQTILQLSKKLQKIEQERDHLKTLISTNTPLISSLPPGANKFSTEDSEFICTMEISKLKTVCQERELTLEESRRLETYYKILTQIKASNKNVEKEVQKISNDDLLKLVELNDSGK